jgi:hypothetical protein
MYSVHHLEVVRKNQVFSTSTVVILLLWALKDGKKTWNSRTIEYRFQNGDLDFKLQAIFASFSINTFIKKSDGSVEEDVHTHT